MRPLARLLDLAALATIAALPLVAAAQVPGPPQRADSAFVLQDAAPVVVSDSVLPPLPDIPADVRRSAASLPYTPPARPGALPMSLDEAVQIALESGYSARLAALDVETAQAQVREAYGGLFPRVEGSSSYTRNVAQANPFAGSSAASLFSGGAATGWLQFNEVARTDGDPATQPITLTEYNRRVGAGQDAIGFNPATDQGNPFGTDNQFTNTLSVTQPLYSPTAFAAVRGARALVEVNEAGLEQQRDETIHQVRQAYYQAALALAQVGVLEGSLERTGSTYDDAVLLVAQGVRPRLEELNARVDVANVRTQLATARTEAATATDRLLVALGLPVETPVQLTTALAVPSDDVFRVAALESVDQGPVPGELAEVDLSGLALDERPDIRQAALAVRLQEVQKGITEAATRPGLNAFANLSYSGNVPDDRTSVFAAPGDPFTFQESTPGFFSDDYWQPALAVGLRLNWTLFDGFQTRRRAQQDQIAIDRAEVQLEQARNAASLEVTAAARQLQSARERLRAQTETVETAEVAYYFATERLDVGAAPLIDVRRASDNLEQSRLALLQAAYDALVARSDYERATGAIEPGAIRPAEPFPALDPPAQTPADPETVVVSQSTTR
ncbi:TolC family protein [Rubrivirga litoralis]|uniref:TolC family protein n=1 Tax=Rubrivirga litoralis TaxID=3075598 RepID=A0ABU3BRL3_9BACT|nr:TolC family protein [Rubrivirga sp. F394]MDT0631930.1 TolC family protein [Rubrivirga sp. F394]